MNSSIEGSKSSMERIEAVVGNEGARLWLNHDIVQTATIPHAPSYFDWGKRRRAATSRRDGTGHPPQRRNRPSGLSSALPENIGLIDEVHTDLPEEGRSVVHAAGYGW
jgi:hypothetical protein